MQFLGLVTALHFAWWLEARFLGADVAAFEAQKVAMHPQTTDDILEELRRYERLTGDERPGDSACRVLGIESFVLRGK